MDIAFGGKFNNKLTPLLPFKNCNVQAMMQLEFA